MINMKTVYGLCALANVFMLVGSIAIARYDLAALNIASGALCAIGYWVRRED